MLCNEFMYLFFPWRPAHASQPHLWLHSIKLRGHIVLYCLLVHCVTPCDTTTHILGVSSDNPQCIKLNIIDMSQTFDFSGGSNSDV